MHSSNWSIALGAVAMLGLAQLAAAEGKPFAVKLAPKQLAVHLDCAAARQNAESRQFAKESAEEKLENNISIQHCEAYAHNYIDQDNPQVVVVAPDPNATGELKILVETVALHELKSVRGVCDAIAKGTFAYLETSKDAESLPANPANLRADVATEHDDVPCDVALQAANQKNPLFLVTPEFLDGFNVDVHVLQLIGEKKPADEVQQAAKAVAASVGKVAPQTSAQVRAVPVVLLPPAQGQATISGSLAARLHAPCKLHVACHYGVFSQTCEHKCGSGWETLTGALGPMREPADARHT
jgi:hypothetical protein